MSSHFILSNLSYLILSYLILFDFFVVSLSESSFDSIQFVILFYFNRLKIFFSFYAVCHGDPVLLLSYCKEHWDGTYVHLYAHVHTHTMCLVFIISTLLPSPFFTLFSSTLISLLHTYPRSLNCPPISF